MIAITITPTIGSLSNLPERNIITDINTATAATMIGITTSIPTPPYKDSAIPPVNKVGNGSLVELSN